MAPTDRHWRLVSSGGARGHDMDDVGSAVAVRAVGGGVMQRAAVVEQAGSGLDRDQHGGTGVDGLLGIEQRAGALRGGVAMMAQVAARNELHGSIIGIGVVEGDPAADQGRRLAAPIAVVLMPGHRPAVPGRFEQRLIVVQLNIRPDQCPEHRQDRRVVKNPVEDQAAFAALGDLEHPLAAGRPGRDVGVSVRRQIAHGSAGHPGSGFAEQAIVFAAQFRQQAGVDHPAIGRESFTVEGFDLFVGWRFLHGGR